jgi:hypothetical protein
MAAAPLLAAVQGSHVAGPSRPEKLDPFFAHSDGILKTYEIDYDAVEAYDSAMAWSGIVGACFAPPLIPFALCGMCCFGSYIKPNIRDKTRAAHLAISLDGVRFVVDRHPAECRLDCQEVGKVSKTVPYDKMTDCDIEEPAGSSGCCCYLVPNTLHVVHIDTASSGVVAVEGKAAVQRHELTLRGLVDAEGFKRDVWAMKRGEVVDGVNGTVAPLAVSMARDGLGAHAKAPAGRGDSEMGSSALVPLLDEQTKLLRELLEAQKETNTLLRQAH